MVRKAFSYICVNRELLHLQNGIYIKVKILNIYESSLSHLEDYFLTYGHLFFLLIVSAIPWHLSVQQCTLL